MQIVLSDVDLERMPIPLKTKLLTYIFQGLASAEGSEAKEADVTFNGFTYARLKVDGVGDDNPLVVLNDDQARELFDSIRIKKSKKNDSDFAYEVREYSDTLKLLYILARAQSSEDLTPAQLAEQLAFDDARQIGPLLNSINKSLRKLTRNPEAALFLRDASSGGYVLHPTTREALIRAYEPFVQDLISTLQGGAEKGASDD